MPRKGDVSESGANSIGPMKRRQYLGRFLRAELFIPALVLFLGVKYMASGEGGIGIALLAGWVLIALMVLPGPLRAAPASVVIALAAAALLLLAWWPLWRLWLDGQAGAILSFITAAIAAEILGIWHDRVVGHRHIAEQVKERMDSGYPVNIPALFLHCHHGRWFSMAESTLPIPLQLRDGTSRLLLPGDRHFWLTRAKGRAPDMAEMNRPREIFSITEPST